MTQKYTFFWDTYTQELLQWQQGEPSNKEIASERILSPAEKNSLARARDMGQRKNTEWYIFLGADALSVQYFLQDFEQNHACGHILVLESDPQKYGHFQKEMLRIQGHMPEKVHALVDSSPWALLLLTLALGLTPDTCTLLFCDPPQERSRCLTQWRKLFLGTHQEHFSPAQESASISLHVIMHPDEPHKEAFFAHIPSWIQEVLVIWDAPSTSYMAPFACAAPVRHFYRPLNKDFSAQRNVLLAHNTSPWILYLDADERLEANTWEHLRQCAQPAYSGGVLLPRLTFERDAQHVRMGHGLWPDIQLRLFPHHPHVRFEGSIHEQVHGLEGPPVLLPTLALWHYSHIHKTPEELKKRLEIFNQSGNITHQLSAAYPALSTHFFHAWQKQMEHALVLRLPI